jgi:hypothetical protein
MWWTPGHGVVLALPMMSPRTVGVACAAALGLVTSSARASDGDADSSGILAPVHLEVAGRAVVSGTQLASPTYGAPGPLTGGGAGGRAGALYRGLYGGLTYMDYFSQGSCVDGSLGGCGSSHGFSYGIEGGYGRTFAKLLVLRAVLGVGDYATTFEDTTTVCQTLSCYSTTSRGSTHSMYLEPQAMVALTAGYVLVGLDAGVFYLPHIDQPVQSSTFASYRVGFQLGVRL